MSPIPFSLKRGEEMANGEQVVVVSKTETTEEMFKRKAAQKAKIEAALKNKK